MENECPYCKNDMLDNLPKRFAILLARENNIQNEYMNPGGRELLFPFGTIQLSDMCNHCDLERLKKEIEKLQNERSLPIL